MIGGWNLFQINAMTSQITEVTGGQNSIFYNNGWALGLIVAIITWVTIIGGIKSIGKFTSKVTPVMCSLYILSAFLVCLLNIKQVPSTISLHLELWKVEFLRVYYGDLDVQCLQTRLA